MSTRLPAAAWEQLKTAHAAGAGLRELARNMGIPEGTVLARRNVKAGHNKSRARKTLFGLSNQTQSRRCNRLQSVYGNAASAT
jgi:hypothetical protein